MSQRPRTEATLPSVLTGPAVAGEPNDELCLTVVFHPDLSRIGASAYHPLAAGGPGLDLGRLQPGFSRPGDQAPRALDEPHISRHALSLELTAASLRLLRLPGACRCQVNGGELAGALELPLATLRRGVPLLLGHGVLLWLALRPPRPPDGVGAGALLGGSSAMAGLRREVTRAGSTDLDVLILGETGVGKELVAQAIHQASVRADRPLVPVNMAAIPATLATSLLFGSARGAYTGAQRGTRGFFQQADGGTLFMDEVGATPQEVQPQLLRALQQRQVQVVGGAPQRVDLRVIAATDAAVDDPGSGFSAALRHRLGSIELRVPPLRERLEDVGELLLHAMGLASEELGQSPLLPGSLHSEVRIAQWAALVQRLLLYDWPGNVRELVNVARQLTLAGDRAPTLPAGLAVRLRDADAVAEGGPAEGPSAAVPDCPATPRQRIAQIDDEHLRQVFRECAYEVAAAARALGVSRQSLYRRLQSVPGLRLAADVPEREVQAALRHTGGNVEVAARKLEVSAAGLRARLRRGSPPC